MLMGAYYGDGPLEHPIPGGWSAYNVRIAVNDFLMGELIVAGSDAEASALDIGGIDFVTQRATEVGCTFAQFPTQPRFSRTEMALYWLRGFLQWYRTYDAALRQDTVNHRLPADDITDGMLIVAKKRYPRIGWTRDYIDEADCLWRSAAITETVIDRVEGFWDRAAVETWMVVRGTFGFVRMPARVRYAGKTITLGWEVTHDWILPKDANHGVSILTISHILGQIALLNGVGGSLQTSARRTTAGYSCKSGNVEHILALGNGTGDVVTCYRV